MTNHTTSKTNGQAKIYALVTEQVIAALKAGTIPWRKPWRVYTPTLTCPQVSVPHPMLVSGDSKQQKTLSPS